MTAFVMAFVVVMVILICSVIQQGVLQLGDEYVSACQMRLQQELQQDIKMICCDCGCACNKCVFASWQRNETCNFGVGVLFYSTQHFYLVLDNNISVSLCLCV